MPTFEELDQRSSGELHDRAVELAKKRHDIRFFWKLFESIPEARAIAGDVDTGRADIQRASNWFFDFRQTDGQLDEALRPVYVEYLLEHESPEA